MSESASADESNNGYGSQGRARPPASGRMAFGQAKPGPDRRDAGQATVTEPSRGRFLIVAQPGRAEAADLRALRAAVERLPEVVIVSKPDPQAEGAQVPKGPRVCPPVLVVEASLDRMLELAASGEWLIEPDQVLSASAYRWAGPLLVAVPSLFGVTAPIAVTVVVRGRDGRPVPDAAVYTHGVWPGYAVTGVDGRAVLTLPAACADTATAVIVAPAADSWGRLVAAPQLTGRGPYEVTVEPLEASFAGFPDRPLIGWGTSALRVGQLPPNYRGHGVKIALVDSGIATDHPTSPGGSPKGRTSLPTRPGGISTLSARERPVPGSSPRQTTTPGSPASRSTPRSTRSKPCLMGPWPACYSAGLLHHAADRHRPGQRHRPGRLAAPRGEARRRA